MGLALPSLLQGLRNSRTEMSFRADSRPGGLLEVEDDYTARRGQGKPTDTWRPLNPQETQRTAAIAAIVKAPLKFQPDAEPSLTVLAYMESLPTLCGCEPDWELRPALLRWLWTKPRRHVPAALEVLLSIPEGRRGAGSGKTCISRASSWQLSVGAGQR